MLRKKGLLVSAIFLCAVLFVSVGARNAASDVAGGRHDLSMWGGSGGFGFNTLEICVFCHTPHGANVNQGYYAPGGADQLNDFDLLRGQWLWNRKLPIGPWLVYNTQTLDANTADGPGPLSLMCLSCHDGIGAMNVLLNYSNSDILDPSGVMTPLNPNQIGDLGLLDPITKFLSIGEGDCTGPGGSCSGGRDLRNDHPIGFAFDAALRSADGELKEPTNAALIRRMAITNNSIECSSCHDPHKTNSGTPGNMFLVMPNAGSALCLQCHDK